MDNMTDEKPAAMEVESFSLNGVSSLEAKMHGAQLTTIAKDGAILEHNLSPWEAVKAYPMAIFWALLVSMCVIMEGYDTILIGNFYAYPTFAKKYGTYFPEVGYQLSAPWQAGLGNASGVGAFFGVLLNGYLVGRFGQKVGEPRVYYCHPGHFGSFQTCFPLIHAYLRSWKLRNLNDDGETMFYIMLHANLGALAMRGAD